MSKDDLVIKDFTRNRRLQILRIENLIKEIKEDHVEKIMSRIEYETGLTEKTVNEFLKILYDIGKIKIENKIVMWAGD